METFLNSRRHLDCAVVARDVDDASSAPPMAPAAPRSTWDPLLIISQIVALQTLHYLTLSILTPPLLALVADPARLEYAGGAANVGMIMDWREIAGRSTLPKRGIEEGRWFSGGAWSGFREVALALTNSSPSFG